MPTRISGPFDVKMTPQPPDVTGTGDPAIGRVTLDKQFRGELEAVSKGQMLAFRSAVQGSAGYVAMERVVGTLAGRAGSFVLQHAGLMDRGTPSLTIHVVPDSGTDQLAGLTGTMAIRVENKAHFYDFDFALPG